MQQILKVTGLRRGGGGEAGGRGERPWKLREGGTLPCGVPGPWGCSMLPLHNPLSAPINPPKLLEPWQRLGAGRDMDLHVQASRQILWFLLQV